MYLANVINDYDDITDYNKILSTDCTNTENEDANIFFKYLLLSLPSSILIFFLLSIMAFTSTEPFSKTNEKFLQI